MTFTGYFFLYVFVTGLISMVVFDPMGNAMVRCEGYEKWHFTVACFLVSWIVWPYSVLKFLLK